MSFDTDNVREARNYLVSLLNSGNQEDLDFLASCINEIFGVFTEMFDAIF